MKYTLAIAAMLIAGVSGNALAEEGHVSQSQLSEMGLPGMTVLSDAQGEEIRGQGFAYASSTSVSRLPGTRTRNHAKALGFKHADAATDASSAAELDILIFGKGFAKRKGVKLLSIQAKVAVGSAGGAVANSR